MEEVAESIIVESPEKFPLYFHPWPAYPLCWASPHINYVIALHVPDVPDQHLFFHFSRFGDMVYYTRAETQNRAIVGFKTKWETAHLMLAGTNLANVHLCFQIFLWAQTPQRTPSAPPSSFSNTINPLAQFQAFSQSMAQP